MMPVAEKEKKRTEVELLRGLEQLCRAVRDYKSDAQFIDFIRSEMGSALDQLTKHREEKEQEKRERKKRN